MKKFKARAWVSGPWSRIQNPVLGDKGASPFSGVQVFHSELQRGIQDASHECMRL